MTVKVGMRGHAPSVGVAPAPKKKAKDVFVEAPTSQRVDFVLDTETAKNNDEAARQESDKKE